MKAIISEILKKDPATTFYYKVGDEYPPARYYPNDNTRYGDGLLVFFVGSPADMMESMTFSGDRISGLGDMSLTVFREKCAGEVKTPPATR